MINKLKKRQIIVWGIVLFFIVIFTLVITLIKNSDAYELSISTIKSNSIILEKYGNVEFWFMPLWSISTQWWWNWEANLQININWDKNIGTVYVDLLKKYGKRDIVNMIVVDKNDNTQQLIWREWSSINSQNE